MDISIKNGKLHIVAPLDKSGKLSASGKNLTVASTGGFVAIPDSDVRVNLTAIKPPK